MITTFAELLTSRAHALRQSSSALSLRADTGLLLQVTHI
jgi:hypothetical protein